MVGLVRSLALETARTGVTVNAVCPGYTDTDMVAGGVAAITAKTGQVRTEQALAELVKDNPRAAGLVQPNRRSQPPCSISAARPSASVTGQSLLINGEGVLRWKRPPPASCSTARPRPTSAPADHKDELRLWLRLLTCSTLIETEVRRPAARGVPGRRCRAST